MSFVLKHKGATLGVIGQLPDEGGSIDRQIPIEVADEDECEKCDCVVCALATEDSGMFQDNIHTLCVDCQREIIHRPHAPKTPPKVCMECAVQRIKRDGETA